jgi:hypothetical protein
MIATILTYLTASSVVPVAAGALLTYLLGLASKSQWYAKAREAVGRFSMAAGVGLSAIGASKLKFLWNPLESVLCDFILFAAEQFSAGLRKDNPEKMEQHLARLEDVGSVTRATALAAKIEALGRAPKPVQDAQDAAMFSRAFKAADSSINQLKKE